MAFVTLLITIIICFTVGSIIYNCSKPKQFTFKDIRIYRDMHNKIIDLCKTYIKNNEIQNCEYVSHSFKDIYIIIHVKSVEDSQIYSIKILYKDLLKQS